MIPCPRCKVPLPRQACNTRGLVPCPACDNPVRIDVYSSFFHQPEDRLAEGLVAEDEASCFYHRRKRAVVHCDSCGRFLCSLCDVEFRNRHLCPQCIESGKKKKRIREMETHRVLYDDVALALAIIPLLLFWITLVTAPLSIFLAIRHWKTPSSIIPRTKARLVAAIGLAGVQIAGWAVFFTMLLRKVV